MRKLLKCAWPSFHAFKLINITITQDFEIMPSHKKTIQFRYHAIKNTLSRYHTTAWESHKDNKGKVYRKNYSYVFLLVDYMKVIQPWFIQ